MPFLKSPGCNHDRSFQMLYYLFIIKLKQWKDEFLQWDPLSYSGISMIRVPFMNVWTPGFINEKKETFFYFNPKCGHLIFANKHFTRYFSLQSRRQRQLESMGHIEYVIYYFIMFHFEICL